MAEIPANFGAGGAGLTPGSSSTPSLATALRDVATDLAALQGSTVTALGGSATTALGGSAVTALGGSAVTAIATPDGSDAGTTQTLANATKAKVNTLITRVEDIATKVEAVITRLEAIATKEEAIITRLEAIATKLGELRTVQSTRAAATLLTTAG